MYCTPVPLLQRMISSQHFVELMAAYRMGLLPDPWLQTGTVAAAIVNSAPRDKSSKPIKPTDFIPRVR